MLYSKERTITMPIIPGVINGHGPLIIVGFKPKDKSSIAITCQALIDTGSNCSIIDTSLVNSVDCVLYSSGVLHTISGVVKTNFYKLDLFIQNNDGTIKRAFDSHIVHSQDYKDVGHKFIIGRDILSRCKFTYDGANSTYMLEW